MFENNGLGGFENISDLSGLDNSFLTTGSAHGDLNNDGFVDIFDEIKDANKFREQFQQSPQSGRRRGNTRRSQHGMDMLSEADVENIKLEPASWEPIS